MKQRERRTLFIVLRSLKVSKFQYARIKANALY